MKLRPYQQAAYDAVLSRFDAGEKSTLALLATGLGKTVIFSHIANHYSQHGRILVVAHRTELIEQAAAKILAITGKQAEIEKAGQYARDKIDLGWQSPFVVASIQTLVARMGDGLRMERFDPATFSIVIIDEVHHAVARTYKKVIAHFCQNDNTKLFGVTATGDRADGLGLGESFDSIAYEFGILDAINDGWLVNVVQSSVIVSGLDFSRCRTTAGDINAGDLAETMEFEKNLHPICHASIEICCGLPQNTLKVFQDVDDRTEKLRALMDGRRCRKALVFCVSVNQAIRTAEILNRWMPNSARSVDGKTPAEMRAEIFADYAAGEFPFLVNCAVTTEGFDDPSIKVIVMARPTASRALAIQMIGRGTRPLESIAHRLGDCADAEERRAMIAASAKPAVEVLDFVGNSGRHELVTAIDILAGTASEDVIAAAKRAAQKGPVNPQQAIEKAKIDKEARQHAERVAAEERERVRREEAAKRKAIVGTARDYHVSNSTAPRGTTIKRESSDPMFAHLPKKMVELMLKAKVPEEHIQGMTRGKAGEVIAELKRGWAEGLRSYRQAMVLHRAGWTKAELHDMTFEQAGIEITALKANGWQRPVII